MHHTHPALLAVFSSAAVALLSTVATAQDTAAPAPLDIPAAAPSAAPQGPGSAISVQLNLDYTTGYFYRGIIQEDSGLMLQPAARLTFNLAQDGDFKLDAFAGAWNSFHGQKTGSQTRGDFSEYWYEADLYAGFTITKGKLTLTTSYTFLTSPNDAFETVQELGFLLSLDDSEWMGKLALKPYAMVAIETGADASDGADSDTGSYFELGISPGFAFDVGKTPVSIAFPASIGLSLGDYYQDAAGEDETFGFAQVGAKASLPLPVNERFGLWTLSAGASLLFMGEHTEEYNAGDDTEVIGSVGLQWNF